MNIRALVIALFAVLSFFSQPLCAGEKIPAPQGRINDYANVIPDEYRRKLDTLVAEIENKTTAEIAVVTVGSIAPYDEKGYARLIFDAWKIGKRGKDNGALVLLAIKERRWRIETGYGLEGILPDGRCGEIGRAYMVPYLKSGDYGKGLYNGVAAIAAIIAADAHVSLETSDGAIPVRRSASDDALFLYFFVPVFFFVWSLPWPVYLGLPVSLLFALCFWASNPILSLLTVGSYAASMIVRYAYWRHLPSHKRHNFLGPQTYGGRFGGGTGGFGGGFGGGGFGGGSGGGGGGGGGF